MSSPAERLASPEVRGGPAGGGSPQVAVIRWPAEADLVELVRSLGVPRLLLVGPDDAPPLNVDAREDWIRLPASDDDVRFRATVLAVRAGAGDGPTPRVPGDGRLVLGDRWVTLSPLEEAIAAELCAHLGQVVTSEQLCGTGSEPLSRGALRVHIMKFRRRVESLGLRVRTVHGHGYVLEVA